MLVVVKYVVKEILPHFWGTFNGGNCGVSQSNRGVCNIWSGRTGLVFQLPKQARYQTSLSPDIDTGNYTWPQSKNQSQSACKCKNNRAVSPPQHIHYITLTPNLSIIFHQKVLLSPICTIWLKLFYPISHLDNPPPLRYHIDTKRWYQWSNSPQDASFKKLLPITYIS